MQRRLYCLLLLCASASAPAATFTVRSTADTGGSSCAADCTLRQAINAANALSGPDFIHFAIPGEGPHRIAPASNLPTITEFVILDGYTQPGALPNTREDFASNAVIQVHLDGSGIVGGLGLASCASNVQIRGLAVSGFAGFQIAAGFNSAGAPCGEGSGTRVAGNFIGIDPLGRLATGDHGIAIENTAVTIGGTLAGERNVFAGLVNGAIRLRNNVAGTLIDGNSFGADPSGRQARGGGVALQFTIGSNGVAVGQARANLFAFHPEPVVLESSAGAGSRLGGNAYSGAIDLASDGVTPNDLNDADTGPNNRQNFPVLNQAVRGPRSLTVSGTLDRPSGSTPLLYSISLYASRSCLASGHGPGERLLDRRTITLANGSSENFAYTVSGIETPALGEQVTAIATDANGNSSEFSACSAVSEYPSAFIVTNTAASGSGSLRAAIDAANANADGDIIAFAIPGSGPHTIADSGLLSLDAPVLVDGYSQAGASANTDPATFNAALMVELGGQELRVCGADSEIRGLGFVAASGTAYLRIGSCGLAPDPSGVSVVGNRFGLQASGALLASRPISSLLVNGGSARVGGSRVAERNAISGSVPLNVVGGVLELDGNLIGAGLDGLTDACTGTGVRIFNEGRVIAGARLANAIGFCTTGIRVDTLAGFSSAFAANAIYLNDNLGIDLGVLGVTANDPNDSDTGPNDLQNFPVLQHAQSLTGGGLRVFASLDVGFTAVPKRYAIAIHQSASCDPSGHGEGSVLVGTTDVVLHDPLPTPPGIFVESFVLQFAADVAAGSVLTATATDADGNTSEFSRCLIVAGPDQLLRNGFD